MRLIILLLTLIASLTFANPVVDPIAYDIMVEVKEQYRDSELDLILKMLITSKDLSDHEFEKVKEQVEYFLDSDQFFETGGAYLTALFTEQELESLLTLLQNESLIGDENFRSGDKLKKMMNLLRPYIGKYLVSKLR